MLDPGLSKSPHLLLAMAWLVGAKKVADRHSSPSSSAKQGQCEMSCPTCPTLICALYCCSAPHPPGMSLDCGSRAGSRKHTCCSKSAEPAGRWISRPARVSISVLSNVCSSGEQN